MRKLIQSTGLSVAILGLLWFSGCTDDDSGSPSPTISVTSDQDIANDAFTGYQGDTLHLEVGVNAPAGFNNLEILVNGVRDTLISRTAGTTQTSFSTNYDYFLENVGDVTLTFKTVDDANNSGSRLLSLTVEQKPTSYFKAKLLYAPAADFGSKTFFSTNDGSTYTKTEVEVNQSALSPNVDFGYYYGATDKASLASPNAYPSTVYNLSAWTSTNATKLKSTNLSVNDFLSNQNDVSYINDAYANATAGSNDEIVTNIQIGEILAFQLDDLKGNKKGLIRVTGLEEGTEAGDYIEIEVIVAK